jgi:hypothetical protein
MLVFEPSIPSIDICQRYFLTYLNGCRHIAMVILWSLFKPIKLKLWQLQNGVLTPHTLKFILK